MGNDSTNSGNEKRYRMETIDGMTFPFIVDNYSAKKKSDRVTSYHNYETHRKKKCLELVDLLNDYEEQISALKYSNKILRINKKDCEKGRTRERKQFNKFDETRVKRIRFLENRLKENGLSIYEWE